MTNDACAPYMGPALIDVTKISSKLVDITNGNLQGFQRQKPGIDDVLNELSKAIPQYGENLGIHLSMLQKVSEKTELLAEIRSLKRDVLKLAEVLEESEIFYEDAREADISRIGGFVDATIRHGDPSVQAAFNQTLKYRSQYAEKAAATRRKNKLAEAEALPGPDPKPAQPNPV
ncbi:hypothetical protein [Polyangium aurulentum]|uniref:hypothetical protein n=1 Tax=Polyangium aurulentum TaxID=2567896 RepID=UPI0010ADB820|nr:hypothetical protein [Polyangium aurulentum]UQA62791.1 hypothetical protein E8A73_021005 [Polyangium aurulentum]